MSYSEELEILVKSVFDGTGLRSAKHFIEQFSEETSSLKPKLMFHGMHDNLRRALKLGGKLIGQGEILQTGLDIPGLREIPIDFDNAGRTAAKLNSIIAPMTENMEKIKSKELAELDATFNKVMGPSKKFNNVLGDITSRGKKHAQMLNDLGIDYTTTSGRTIRGMKDMKVEAKKMKKAFSMEFLGVMFGGMMIQKTFMRMATVAQESFMRITEGQGVAAQSFHALGASIELVKFSLGNTIAQVIQPFIPTIIEIAEKVSDWIGNNKKLVAGIVIGGLALGTFSLILGQTVLYGEALMNVFGAKGLLGTLIKFGSANPIIATILIIIATILAITMAIPQYREELKEMWVAVKDSIGPVLTNLMEIIFGTDDWKEALKKVGSVGVWLTAGFGRLLIVIGQAVDLLSSFVRLFLTLLTRPKEIASVFREEKKRLQENFAIAKKNYAKLGEYIEGGPMGAYFGKKMEKSPMLQNTLSDGSSTSFVDLYGKKMEKSPMLQNALSYGTSFVDLFGKTDIEDVNYSLSNVKDTVNDLSNDMSSNLAPIVGESLPSSLEKTKKALEETDLIGQNLDLTNLYLLEDSQLLIDQTDDEVNSWESKAEAVGKMDEKVKNLIESLRELNRTQNETGLSVSDVANGYSVPM